MAHQYYTSDVLLNQGDIDEIGAANYPTKSQNTPERLVFELQSDLRELGYLLAAPDGVFGEGTERAVRQFQTDHELEVDGFVGKDTKAALREASRKSEKRDEGLTHDYLRQQLMSLEYKFDEQPLHMNIIGIRGFWHGEAVANTFNEYNDTIFVLWKDDDGNKRHVDAFDASCDPGKLTRPLEKGVAHLIEGQYLFAQGRHRGKYRALRQARPVRVKRYFDDDPERLTPYIDEGFFGINIHCGGISDEVNNWSAGCQIIKGGKKGPQWKRFDQLIYETAPAEQRHFRYTLIRGESLTD